MRDDPEFNIALVQEIEKYPFLYDPTNIDYPNRDINNRAWREISETTGEAVVDIKARWRNLRNRHFKVKTDLLSGSKRKSYYLSSHLHFLDCLDDLRFTEGSAVSANEEITTVKAEPHDEPFVGDAQVVYNEPAEGSRYLDEGMDELCQFSDNDPANSRPRLKAKRSNGYKHRFPSSQLQHNAEETTERSNCSILEDPDFAFLYSVGFDMKLMKTAPKRKFKLQLLKLVDDTLNNQFTDNAHCKD